MKKIYLSILLLSLILVTPITSFAQSRLDYLLPSQESLFDRVRRADIDQSGTIDENERFRFTDQDLEQEFAPRVLSLLIGFSSLLITIFFIFAGLRLVLSRGDEEALTKTKQLIVQAIIGTFLILASFGIIVNVIRFFNVI